MEDKHIVRKRKDRKMGTKKPEWAKRRRFFLCTFALFLISLPWSYRGFFDAETGDFRPLWLVLCVAAWAAAAALSFVKWEGFQKRAALWREIGLLGISVAGLAMFCIFSVGDYQLTPWFVISNLIPIYILVRIIHLFANSLTLTATIAGIICLAFAGVNFYVYELRARPIYPWDIFSLGTAAVVAEDYQIVACVQLIASYLIFVILHQLVTFLPKESERSVKKVGANAAVAACLVLIYAYGIFPQFSTSIWAVIFNNAENGTVASFISYLPWAFLEKPEGYDTAEAEAYLEKVGETKADESRTSAVNIIMIMDESMTDYAVFGDRMAEALPEDPMPFFHSLQENTVRGNLYVSCYGGNTCDTEFESLTGNSILYAPNTPFETQFHGPMPSIVSTLKDDGYEAIAMHPLGAADWNRDDVYRYLGFTSFTTLEDLDQDEENFIRGNYSDQADFAWIIDRFEQKKEGEPFFLFNVTMQNHGGYGQETLDGNWQVSTDLSALGDYPQAELFFSLMKETDQAIEKLVTYFSQVEEPTIICIYGDHQPDLQDDFLDVLYGEPESEVSHQERQKKYTTPFVIWANYDIEETTIDKMSANYLGPMLLRYANVDMSAYDTFLLDLYENYPVIASTGIYDAQGNFYDNEEEANSERIDLYQKLQYYQMKDAR